MVAPPFSGAVQETCTDPLPGEPVGCAGATGGPTGVADCDVAAPLVPTEFVAVTLNVYVVPFVRPETVHCVAAAVDAVEDVEHTLPTCDVDPT